MIDHYIYRIYNGFYHINFRVDITDRAKRLYDSIIVFISEHMDYEFEPIELSHIPLFITDYSYDKISEYCIKLYHDEYELAKHIVNYCSIDVIDVYHVVDFSEISLKHKELIRIILDNTDKLDRGKFRINRHGIVFYNRQRIGTINPYINILTANFIQFIYAKYDEISSYVLSKLI